MLSLGALEAIYMRRAHPKQISYTQEGLDKMLTITDHTSKLMIMTMIMMMMMMMRVMMMMRLKMIMRMMRI